MTLNQVNSEMNEFQNVTNANGVPYLGVTENSNSYAFTFVQSLGIPRPQPLQGFPAPGSNVGAPSPNLNYANQPIQFSPWHP